MFETLMHINCVYKIQQSESNYDSRTNLLATHFPEPRILLYDNQLWIDFTHRLIIYDLKQKKCSKIIRQPHIPNRGITKKSTWASCIKNMDLIWAKVVILVATKDIQKFTLYNHIACEEYHYIMHVATHKYLHFKENTIWSLVGRFGGKLRKQKTNKHIPVFKT